MNFSRGIVRNGAKLEAKMLQRFQIQREGKKVFAERYLRCEYGQLLYVYVSVLLLC